MITIYVDADGCPVVNETIALARKHQISVVLVCDDAHVMQREGAQTLQVAKGRESADIALMNRIKKGDILITQDYGLAAVCLGKQARVIHQDGREYTHDNIEGLLFMRHENRKMRSQGKRTKGPKKRTKAQDEAFITALEKVITAISL